MILAHVALGAQIGSPHLNFLGNHAFKRWRWDRARYDRNTSFAILIAVLAAAEYTRNDGKWCVALSLVACAEPPVQIEGSADQCQVGKCLWKIAQRFTLRACLLCVKPEMIGVTEHSFEEDHGLV